MVRSRKAKPADIEAICLTLPEVELGITWGDRPTYVVPKGKKGRGFVLYRKPGKTAIDPRTDEPFSDLLVIRTSSPEEKEALVQDEGTPFFTIPHLAGTNAVLVQQSRLAELTYDELAEVITEAWRAVAPKSLVKAFDKAGKGR